MSQHDDLEYQPVPRWIYWLYVTIMTIGWGILWLRGGGWYATNISVFALLALPVFHVVMRRLVFKSILEGERFPHPRKEYALLLVLSLLFLLMFCADSPPMRNRIGILVPILSLRYSLWLSGHDVNFKSWLTLPARIAAKFRGTE